MIGRMPKTFPMAALAALVLGACSAPEQAGQQPPRPVDEAVIRLTPDDDLADALRNAHRRDGALTLRLAPGRYEISNTVRLPSHTLLVGEASGITTIVATQPIDSMITNEQPETGDQTLRISGVTFDCERRAQRALLLVRVSNLDLEDVEVTGCQTEGMRVSGRGEVTRGVRLSNVTARDNPGDGLIFMWATRNAQYVNVSAHFNGGRGVVFDHSEFQATNISACDNRGDGVHLRNFFAADLNGLYVCRNGRHGVFVEGMVASTGSGWIAQSNSRSQPGVFDEIHFSSRGDLSYGVSQNSALTGVFAGSYRNGFGDPTARHGVYFAESVSVDIAGANFDGLLSDPVCNQCTE